MVPEPRFEVIDADEVAGDIIPKGSGHIAGGFNHRHEMPINGQVLKERCISLKSKGIVHHIPSDPAKRFP